MSDIIVRLLLVAGLVALYAVVLNRSFARSEKVIDRWAKDCGGVVTRSGRRMLWTVRITDRDGRTREGWVRCGNPLIGLNSDEVRVRWRKPPSV